VGKYVNHSRAFLWLLNQKDHGFSES
jgi:hypothetical protein